MTGAPRGLRGRLAASVLVRRDFRLLWVGQAVSAVGDQIFPVAVSLRVLENGGDAGDIGLVLAGRMLALVAFVLVGGVWADRLPRRRVLLAADALRLAAVGGLAIVPAEVGVLGLAALTFVVGGGEAFFRPAYAALVPSLVPAERLASANACKAASEGAAAAVGPALGGLLVAVPVVLLTPVSLAWVTLGYAVAGFAMMPLGVLWETALQREFPPALLGRVTPVDWLASFALLPVGLAIVGPAVDLVGRGPVLAAAAAAQVASSALVLLVPGVRDLHDDRRPARV